MKYNINEMEFLTTFEYRPKQSKFWAGVRVAGYVLICLMYLFAGTILAYSIVMFGTNYYETTL